MGLEIEAEKSIGFRSTFCSPGSSVFSSRPKRPLPSRREVNRCKPDMDQCRFEEDRCWFRLIVQEQLEHAYARQHLFGWRRNRLQVLIIVDSGDQSIPLSGSQYRHSRLNKIYSRHLPSALLWRCLAPGQLTFPLRAENNRFAKIERGRHKVAMPDIQPFPRCSRC